MDILLKKIYVYPYDSIDHAVSIMTKKNLSGIAVINPDNKLVGILSARDLFSSFYSNKYHNEQSRLVSDFMIKKPTTLKYDDSFSKVIETFINEPYYYFPVIENSLFKGMIYRIDILNYIFKIKENSWN